MEPRVYNVYNRTRYFKTVRLILNDFINVHSYKGFHYTEMVFKSFLWFNKHSKIRLPLVNAQYRNDGRNICLHNNNMFHNL